ncbi:MAG: LLM class flavin-dependent oxidoreductase, partial [Rhodococcus sp. (in: high G+C Gram-positive bacteria)]
GADVRGRALLFAADAPGAPDVDGHIATVTDIDSGFTAWPRPPRTRGYKTRSLRGILRLPDPAPMAAHTRAVYPNPVA